MRTVRHTITLGGVGALAGATLAVGIPTATATGEHRTWRVRRPVIAHEILNQRPDVLGVQEANQSGIYASRLDYGVNQYMDLKGALAAKGGHYALTNPRYLARAVLRMEATGKQFFFSDTHLDPVTVSVRRAQWDEVVTRTKALAGSLPVVAVGDYNTFKWSSYAATYLPKMKAAGHGDVLGQVCNSSVSHPRAAVLDRAWVKSYYAYRRDARGYSHEAVRTRIGVNIDWIFATNSLPVKKWVTDAPIDMSTFQLVGVIPSDPFLIQATVTLQ